MSHTSEHFTQHKLEVLYEGVEERRSELINDIDEDGEMGEVYSFFYGDMP